MQDIDTLYRTYFHDVFRYLRGLTADEHLAEELTQETFFKALKSIQKFRGDCDIRVWLCQIAKNTYYSYYKKQRRELPSEAPLEEAPPTPSKENIENILLDKELAFVLHEILHDLKEPYKEVFTLRVFGELPFGKIGMLFGKSEHWACVTFHRAKEKIQTELEKRDRKGE